MRIISGEFKGHRLFTPKGDKTRPTSDARREVLFNILEHRFAFSFNHVLDLFAGSGALGFEALSRGAKKVLFVESDRNAQECIRKNAQKLGLLQRIEIVGEVLPFRKKSSIERSFRGLAPFNGVFCDPPYGQNWPKKVLHSFNRMNWTEQLFEEMTLLVVEECSKIESLELEPTWNLQEERKQGAGQLFFYRKN